MNRMTLKREDEIRIAVTAGRIDGDTDGDWQDFARELLRELDAERRGRTTQWGISCDRPGYDDIVPKPNEASARRAVEDAARRSSPWKTTLHQRGIGPWIEVETAETDA